MLQLWILFNSDFCGCCLDQVYNFIDSDLKRTSWINKNIIIILETA